MVASAAPSDEQRTHLSSGQQPEVLVIDDADARGRGSALRRGRRRALRQAVVGAGVAFQGGTRCLGHVEDDDVANDGNEDDVARAGLEPVELCEVRADNVMSTRGSFADIVS